jgi:hypothetical protein
MRRRLTPVYGITLALISAAACFATPDPHDPALTPRTPNIRRPVGPGRSGSGIIAKKMTRCDTDEKKFKDTKVGDVVNCVWQY